MNIPKSCAPQLLGGNATVLVGGTSSSSSSSASGSRPDPPTMLVFLTDAKYAQDLASTLVAWVANHIPKRWPLLLHGDVITNLNWFSNEIKRIPAQGHPSAHHFAVFVIAYLLDTFDEIYDMFIDPKNEDFAIVSPERMKTFAAHTKICVLNFLSFSVSDTNAFYTLLTGAGV